MTFILPQGNRPSVPVVTPSEATEEDAAEYGLGDPTTEEDNTPSVILATMLERPPPPPKKILEIGRERAPTVVDRPRPGGGTLLLAGKDPTPTSPGPIGKVKKIAVEDNTADVPDNWKDYL